MACRDREHFELFRTAEPTDIAVQPALSGLQLSSVEWSGRPCMTLRRLHFEREVDRDRSHIAMDGVDNVE